MQGHGIRVRMRSGSPGSFLTLCDRKRLLIARQLMSSFHRASPDASLPGPRLRLAPKRNVGLSRACTCLCCDGWSEWV